MSTYSGFFKNLPLCDSTITAVPTKSSSLHHSGSVSIMPLSDPNQAMLDSTTVPLVLLAIGVVAGIVALWLNRDKSKDE